MYIREPSYILIQLNTLVKNKPGGDTNGVQSLHIFDPVVFVRLGRLALVHFLNSLVTIILQVGPVCKVADDPSERVAQVDTRSDYLRAPISQSVWSILMRG